MQRTIRFVIFFAIFVFVINVLVLDYFLVKQRSDLLDFQTRLTTLSDSFKIIGARFNLFPTTNPTSGSSGTNQPSVDELKQYLSGDICPNSCINLIGAATISAGLPSGENPSRLSTSQLIANGTLASTTPPSTKGEFVVPLGSGSVSQSGTWTDVYTAQSSFDTANFGPIKAFYFEAVMHVPQGTVQAKLVDDTTPFNYDGQVLSTSSTLGQLVSMQVPLISGKKTYHVRLYSNISTGGLLDLATIRIVTQ